MPYAHGGLCPVVPHLSEKGYMYFRCQRLNGSRSAVETTFLIRYSSQRSNYINGEILRVLYWCFQICDRLLT